MTKTDLKKKLVFLLRQDAAARLQIFILSTRKTQGTKKVLKPSKRFYLTTGKPDSERTCITAPWKINPGFFFATKFSATFKKGTFNPGKYQTLAAERYPANILEPATQVKPFARASIERTSFLGSVSLNKLPSPDPPSNSRLNYFKGTFVILKNVYGDQLNLTGPAKNSEIIKRRTLFFKSKQPLALKIFV